MVISEILKPAHESCFNKSKRNQMCWILIGLLFSFSGKIVESVWWSIPWTMAYIDHPKWFKFNSYGVFFNIIFRQAFFTVSAYCHLRAFLPPNTGKKALTYMHYMLFVAFLFGQAFAIYLYYIKNH
jgi:hypothetical protein